MFARTAGLPKRKGSGYVCLACRNERVSSARRNRNERRWNSEPAQQKQSAAQGAAGATDDWLLPLNDLSLEFGDERSLPEFDQGKGERSATHLNPFARDSAKDNTAGRHTRKQRVQGWNRASSKPSVARARDRRVDIPSLLQSLNRANGGAPPTSSRVEKGEEAVDSARAGVNVNAQSSSTSPNPEMQKLWDQLGPGLQQEIDALAAESSIVDSEAQYDEHLEKSDAASPSGLEVKSKEPVPFPSFSAIESTNTPASSLSLFSSALNYVRKKVGLSKTPQGKKVESGSKPQTQVESGASSRVDNIANISKLVAKQAPSAENGFDTLKLPQKTMSDKSPAERWEESSSRRPWGPSAPKAPDRAVASFDDIASADPVSIKKPIATSVRSKPFGIAPRQTIAGLRGQLAETLAKPDDASSSGNEAAVNEDSQVIQPGTASFEVTGPTKAHSRLSRLYTPDADKTAAKISPDAVGTLDSAYLRRQYDQNRAEQDVQASIRKAFPEVSLTESPLRAAVAGEAERGLEGNLRLAQHKKQVPTLSPQIRHRTCDFTSAGGTSLSAAMHAGSRPVEAPAAPKRRAGRPAKEPSSLSKPRAAKRETTADEKAQIATPLLESTPQAEAQEDSSSTSASSADEISSITPSQLEITPLDIPQPPVPYLQYGLDRVLFNPGVYQLQDQASRVYNFDPYLQNIMPNIEFDFDSLKEYKTSSKDEALAKIAKEHGNKYIGSTSSMTSALGHFHYLLSNWRPLNFGMLSNEFVGKGSKPLPDQLTLINRAPSAIFLRWKNGTYAIDADKEHDSANVLMLLGKSMELLLTLPKSDFERYRKSDPRQVSEEQRTAPESYQYTTMRDFLMRSQLDAYDPRLPGNGTFDLKTRAVVSVRMAADDHEPMTGYEIYAQQGKWCSYEKEYYDMIRSTMLKYMLQARMGRMNGIFVAYHNVDRMFGFQYVSIADMDRALHGQTDPSLGDQEFKASLDLLNDVFNAATAKFPEQSLRIHFETSKAENGDAGMPTALHIFAEPMSEIECDTIQDSQKAKIAEWEKTVMGKNVAVVEDGQVDNLSAEELKSSDCSNEVAHDQTAIELQDDAANESEEETSTVAASDNDAQVYARSMLPSEEEVAVEDAAKGPVDNSLSNADPQFLNTLSTSNSAELKPLFYATIIAQHTVNGDIKDRPQNLRSQDEWTVEYILRQYDIGRKQWAEYEDLKARRKMAYVKEAEEEGTEKEKNGYIEFLRHLSQKGRALRKDKDLKEAELPVVRVEDLDMERLDTVDSVEDYMKFLEKPKIEGTREMFG